jgi:hypothetical protein
LGGEESYKVRCNARLTATRHEQAGLKDLRAATSRTKQLSRNSTKTRKKGRGTENLTRKSEQTTRDRAEEEEEKITKN